MTAIYQERRKRNRFAQFEKGSAHDAEQWMQRFEILANFLGFSDEEKAQELIGVLTGPALDWLIGLDPSVSQVWDKVKTAFLQQHAQGDDPTLAAFNELKNYKQGNKLMKVFGPELTTLLQRSGIFLPNIQLDYLKDRLKPELAQAVIMARVQTLAEGIKVATDIERSLSNGQGTAYFAPIKQEQEVIKEEQNYQDK
ncbi:hypothetical protein, partial, partial [Parasitella parasitica]